MTTHQTRVDDALEVEESERVQGLPGDLQQELRPFNFSVVILDAVDTGVVAVDVDAALD